MIKLSLQIMTAIFVVLGTYIYGSALEGYFFPVLKAKIVLGRDSGGYQAFTIEANKLRGECGLVTYGIEWRYDHTVTPTGLANSEGRGVTASVPLVTADGYVLGPFYALVPMSARLREAVALVMTFYYSCHPFWHTSYRIEQAVELTPPVITIPPTTAVPPA